MGLTGLALVAVLAAMVSPVVPAQAASRTEAEPSLSEGQQALAEAQETGQRVEVLGERSERTTVFANPDGYTFTLEESSIPVRVAKPGGGWQEPDPTLEARADGTIGPKAAAAEITFSGGGQDAPLVRIAEQGRSLELGWPGELPQPELDGTSALYREVLPDVDLQVSASTEGFRHVLLVKTPEAAANPELEEIDYTLRADGLKVRKGTAGNLTAVDADGKTIFRAPPAQMWDSAGRAGNGQQSSTSKATQPGAATPQKAEPAEADDSGDFPNGEIEPAPGATIAKMDVKVTKDTLTVVPDAEMLTDTDPEAFPLYIDPTVSWGESERTLLRSDGYESYGWGNGDDGLGRGVGKCGTWNGYYCGPGYVQRLYFEFSPASLKGKKVLDATFRITEPWAFQCEPRWVDLVRTNNISSSTTWASRPKELDWMVDRYVSAGRGSLCDPDSPDAPIEFNDNPEEPNENLTPTVRDFAAGKFSRLTLQLRAHDESDTSAWKRFKNDATLAVDYVGLPAKPTGIGLVAGSGTVCETNASNPAVVSDPTPALTATTQTAAGGENGAQLRIYFDVDHQNTDGTWSDTPAGNGDLRPTSGYVGDNRTLTMSWSTLTEGKLYRYRAWVHSYYNGGNSYLSGPSNASTTGWCHFKIDATAPKAPKITVGSPYTECTPNACTASGGPEVKGTFTFAPAEGDTNNVSYRYRLSSETFWKTVKGTTVSVDITPKRSGTHRLQVLAVDDVGRGGEQSVVDFLVATGEGPVGHWHFDEDSGAAIDSGTDGAARHDATLHGDATRDDRGRRGVITHDTNGVPLEAPVTDKGLTLNGTSAYAATNGPVLETRSSYTLSAWARLDTAPSENATILGQDGSFYSAFYLSYEPAQKTWTLRTSPKDATDGNITEQTVIAKQPATVGVWTHLAAVYDAPANQIRLYVNGKLQGTDSVAPGWSANGPLQVGRVLWRGAYHDHFPGGIDEVTAWQRALTAEELADDARLVTSEGHAGVELVAHWDPTTGSGTTVADTTSGYGRSLTLTGGASLDGEAIVLDGVDDAARTAGPRVDDTGSFTVTTAVELNSAEILAKPVSYTGQVLGQRTADGSAWGLWYQMTGTKAVWDEEAFEERTVPVGFWHFGRLNADGTFNSAVSDEEAALDSMVRLTGVFDAQSGTVSLRVGYLLNDEPEVFTAKVGTGDFTLGRGFTAGTWQHHLPARISDVRLWAGAMAGQEQIESHIGD